MNLNLANIAGFVSRHGSHRGTALDLGCWDGSVTRRYITTEYRTFGVEGASKAAQDARGRSIEVVIGDLNKELPLRSESFDVVTSNQVIEHLYDTDTFLSESYRILRPGGVLCVSTENAASWHNVIALLLGWQSFSLTPVSSKRPAIGNPLASFRGAEPLKNGWQHLRIFSFRGLSELIEAHGFENVRVLGAGYYPLPASIGKRDPRHAAFITATAFRR